MVPEIVPRMDKDGRTNRLTSLNQVFNNASLFRTQPDLVEDIIRGQTAEPAAAWDTAFSESLNNKLFREELDLVALNINRGRDHGLPGYNTYREVCTSGDYARASSWEDLARGGSLSLGDVALLKTLYEKVDDVDLFVGGTMEEADRGSLLGPSFSCIIGDQFRRLKEGDRFYYENGEFRQSRFSPDQLQAIKRVTMARIICDNTDLAEIQPLAFRTEEYENNEAKDCNLIPGLDLGVFQEKKKIFTRPGHVGMFKPRRNHQGFLERIVFKKKRIWGKILRKFKNIFRF